MIPAAQRQDRCSRVLDMAESDLAKSRLAAATETKKLANYPRLRRAILRCQFLAILNVIALSLLIMRDLEGSLDVVDLIPLAIDLGLVGAVVALSIRVSRNLRDRQWKQLDSVLRLAAAVVLALGVLSGAGLVALLLAGQTVAAICLLAAVALFIATRIDLIRGRDDVLALVADNERT
jgi:hypothetical protein